MTMFRAPVLLLLFVGALFVASCGADKPQPGVVAGAPVPESVPPDRSVGDETRTTTPENDAPPTSQVPIEAEPSVEPQRITKLDYGNDNDPTTDYGAACWARVELTNFFLDQLPAVEGLERPQPNHLNLDDALEAVAPALAKARSVQNGSSFIEHFESQIAAARRLAGGKKLTGSAAIELGTEFFSFDSYPGGKEYAEAARAAGCTEP